MIENSSNLESISYNVYSYLKVLVHIQNMSKSDAIKTLTLSSQKENSQYQLILLCKMLFTSKEKEFRPPMIGEPELVGKSDLLKWKFLPIEIVDGIPFLIVKSYTIKGRQEHAGNYLDYCLSECVWNLRKYRIPNKEEVETALKKIINSKKWNKRLDTVAINWFKNQTLSLTEPPHLQNPDIL